MEVNGQSDHSTNRFTPGETAPVYIRQEAGYYREEKNLFPLPRIEPRFLGRPTCTVVSMPSEQSWLSYKLLVQLVGVLSIQIYATARFTVSEL
jgi:hypothetical protein